MADSGTKTDLRLRNSNMLLQAAELLLKSTFDLEDAAHDMRRKYLDLQQDGIIVNDKTSDKRWIFGKHRRQQPNTSANNNRFARRVNESPNPAFSFRSDPGINHEIQSLARDATDGHTDSNISCSDPTDSTILMETTRDFLSTDNK